MEAGMPRYVIHIGPHKTGTTYLQRSFTRMRPDLAARGICYPDCWGGPDGHHNLVEQIWGGNDRSAKAEADRLNGSGFATILLSSETLSYLSDAEVPRLHALLGRQSATVVFYCRRWSELLPSIWQEQVKHGSLTTLPDFALSCLTDPAASEVLNFGRVLSRYGVAFGRENLRLVSYNAVLESGEDLFSHFCRCFLGLPNVPPSGLGRINVSHDMVDVEVLRALNVLEWTRARDARLRLYHRYMAKRPELPVRWLVENALQYVVDRVKLNDAALGLAALHADIFGRYRQLIVPPLPAGKLFEPRSAEVLYIKSDYFAIHGALETLRAIQETLLAAE
jgi:hypothetical protein